MDGIISILMKRDNLTEDEAKEVFRQGKERILEALSNDETYQIEDIMMEEFGLEMDYI